MTTARDQDYLTPAIKEMVNAVCYELWHQFGDAGYTEAAGYTQTPWINKRVTAALLHAAIRQDKP